MALLEASLRNDAEEGRPPGPIGGWPPGPLGFWVLCCGGERGGSDLWAALS